jgi:hypothetical protein
LVIDGELEYDTTTVNLITQGDDTAGLAEGSAKVGKVAGHKVTHKTRLSELGNNAISRLLVMRPSQMGDLA